MTTAEVVSTPADSRPEPPAYPDLFIVQYTTWSDSTTHHRWMHLCDGVPYATEQEAAKASQWHIENGCRNVRIIRIPGAHQ